MCVCVCFLNMSPCICTKDVQFWPWIFSNCPFVLNINKVCFCVRKPLTKGFVFIINTAKKQKFLYCFCIAIYNFFYLTCYVLWLLSFIICPRSPPINKFLYLSFPQSLLGITNKLLLLDLTTHLLISRFMSWNNDLTLIYI